MVVAPSTGIRFGIAMGVGRSETPEDVGQIAARAEELGFQSLWIQDNPLSVRDAYMSLAVASTRTETIMLGPGVSNPVIRHPSVIVGAINTLQQQSHGRAFLGLGSGGPALLGPLGVNPRRAAAFEQELGDIRTLLRGDEVHREDGPQYRVLRADADVPVYVAGNGPRLMKTAAALADGILIGGPMLERRLQGRIDRMAEEAVSLGRTGGPVRVNFLVATGLDEDDVSAGVRSIKPFIAAWIHTNEIKAGRDVPEEFESVIAAVKAAHDPTKHLSPSAPEIELIPDELARILCVAGSQKECRDRLARLCGLGPYEIVLSLPARGRMERLATLSRLVEGVRGVLASGASGGDRQSSEGHGS